MIKELTEKIKNQMDSLSSATLPALNAGENPDAGVVVGVGYPDRVPVCVKNLQQVIMEGLQHSSEAVKISSVALVNFGLNNQEILPLKTLLEGFYKDGALESYTVAQTERHSAARSFNEGVKALGSLRGSLQDLPAFVVKVDDDSRFEPLGLSKCVRAALNQDLDLVAPVTVRYPDPRYEDDAYFKSVCEENAEKLRGETVKIPPYAIDTRRLDLSRLMIGYHTVFSGALTPSTPNENGMTFSRNLINALSQGTGGIFTETKGGSEGLRLFVALSQSPFSERIGVVKSAVFDRPIEAGQLSSWGPSDATITEIIDSLTLMPEGITMSGFNAGGEIYSKFIPGAQKAYVKCYERLNAVVTALETGLSKYREHPEIKREIRDILPLIYDDAKSVVEAIRKNGEAAEVWAYSDPGDPSFLVREDQIPMLISYLGSVHLFCREQGIGVKVYPV